MIKTLQDQILSSGALSRIPSEGSKNRFYEFEKENVLAIKAPNSDEIYITDLDIKDQIEKRTWNSNFAGYPRAHAKWCLDTCQITLSRLVMSDNSEMYHENNVVDHKNGNTYDNRKANLRICNEKENAANKLYKNKYLVKKISPNQYKAQILINDRVYSITADSKEKAENFIINKRNKYRGEFSVDNRVNDGVYDEIVNRIKSAKPVIHFNDPKLEKRYNFTDRN